MGNTIKSFEEFHNIDQSNDDKVEEGIIRNIGDALKNGLGRLFGGRIAKLDSIYGRFQKNGVMSGAPQGELGKLEYEYIVSCVRLDEEILKKMSAGAQFRKSSTPVPDENVIANNEFVKRIEVLKTANKKKFDVKKEAVLDRIERIVGDNRRVGEYAEALSSQLAAAMAESEYGLRKKFASDAELEKLEDTLVNARKDAKDRATRVVSMLSSMGLANSQVQPTAPAPATPNANGPFFDPRKQAYKYGSHVAPEPVAPHKFVP